MKKAEKVFNIVVTVVVVLTGAGFGALTGQVYSGKHWWVGLITGAVSGYPLVIVYLRWLKKLSAKKDKKKIIWLWSTLIAIVCGVICTTVVHGIMVSIMQYHSDVPLIRQMDGFWVIIFGISQGVGAVAGLVVGGICSLVYVLKIKGGHSEAA